MLRFSGTQAVRNIWGCGVKIVSQRSSSECTAPLLRLNKVGISEIELETPPCPSLALNRHEDTRNAVPFRVQSRGSSSLHNNVKTLS